MGSGLLFLVLVATFLLSAALVPASRALGHSLGALDRPGPRKVHIDPTPRTGGIAVFLSFAMVVIVGSLLAPRLGQSEVFQQHFGGTLALLQEAFRVQGKLVAVTIGSTLVFTVGLLDDVLGERFHVGLKFGGQIVAALILVAADVRTSFLPYDWMNVVVTLLWIVGITNAFNLLDNMDGLSAGVAFVASLVLLLNAIALGEFFVSLILVAFMGSLLGFLLYNFFGFGGFRIFLGDCGSLFIGFVMASLTLLERYLSHASSTLFPVLMPVLVLAIPLIDTFTVIVIRVAEGRPVYVGDSRHLSHRLVSLGFRPKPAVLFIWLATFCLGVGALILPHASPNRVLLVLVQAVGFVALLLILLFVERRREERLPAREERLASREEGLPVREEGLPAP
jgi:UDP-GlcNAc:undecaprenyl-phosphate GlcNAc-1-phosphate transferase